MLAYLHPLLGAVAALLAVYVGMQGLYGRMRRADAPERRGAHRRLAPIAGLLVWGAAVGGVLSVAWMRDDLDVAGSAHFWAGSAVAAAMAVGALSSSLRPGSRTQPWHGGLGAVTMLAAVLTLMMGLGLLP